MHTTPYDEFWAALVQLVQHANPNISAHTLARVTGWPFVMAASEEWVDVTTLVLHPALRVRAVRPLYELRSRILDRLNRLGLLTVYTWHDSVLLFETADVPNGTMLIGVQRVPVGIVVAVDDLTCHVNTVYDERVAIAMVESVHPAGFEVISVKDSHTGTHVHDVYDEIAFVIQLLSMHSPILMDTPSHPIRDWQSWHVGIDALEVMAVCGDTAAPLAVMSQAVARVVHVWLARWQLAQTVVRTWAADIPQLHATADVLDDAIYYLQILAQHYPIDCAMRSLSTAEGELVATAMRDARAVWRQVLDQLKQALDAHKTTPAED